MAGMSIAAGKAAAWGGPGGRLWLLRKGHHHVPDKTKMAPRSPALVGVPWWAIRGSSNRSPGIGPRKLHELQDQGRRRGDRHAEGARPAGLLPARRVGNYGARAPRTRRHPAPPARNDPGRAAPPPEAGPIAEAEVIVPPAPSSCKPCSRQPGSHRRSPPDLPALLYRLGGVLVQPAAPSDAMAMTPQGVAYQEKLVAYSPALPQARADLAR